MVRNEVELDQELALLLAQAPDANWMNTVEQVLGAAEFWTNPLKDSEESHEIAWYIIPLNEVENLCLTIIRNLLYEDFFTAEVAIVGDNKVVREIMVTEVAEVKTESYDRVIFAGKNFDTKQPLAFSLTNQGSIEVLPASA